MKKKIKKVKDKTINYFKKIKNEKIIQKRIKNNRLFIVFVLVNVLNSTLLRIFATSSVESFLTSKAILGDLAVVTIIGSFSFLFANKK